MPRRRPPLALLGLLAAMALLLCLSAPPAFAQGPGGATAVAPPPPTATPVVAPTQEDLVFGALAPTPWDWALRLASVFVISALAAWAIYRVFKYITLMQKRYYTVADHMARRGTATRLVPVSARMPSGGGGDRDLGGKELQVKGPNTLTVGATDEYKAVVKTDDTETPAAEATWQVAPEGIATLDATTGATVRVTAKQQGAFELVVSVKGAAATDQATEVHFPVAVIAPTAQPIDLPFVGEGWGTIILAILFGTIVALLGLSRVLSTSLVGTLLGALLGYIFGVATSGGTKAAGEGAAGGSKSGDTGPR